MCGTCGCGSEDGSITIAKPNQEIKQHSHDHEHHHGEHHHHHHKTVIDIEKDILLGARETIEVPYDIS